MTKPEFLTYESGRGKGTNICVAKQGVESQSQEKPTKGSTAADSTSYRRCSYCDDEQESDCKLK